MSVDETPAVDPDLLARWLTILRLLTTASTMAARRGGAWTRMAVVAADTAIEAEGRQPSPDERLEDVDHLDLAESLADHVHDRDAIHAEVDHRAGVARARWRWMSHTRNPVCVRLDRAKARVDRVARLEGKGRASVVGLLAQPEAISGTDRRARTRRALRTRAEPSPAPCAR